MKADLGFWIWVTVSYAIGIACVVYLLRRVRRGEYITPMQPAFMPMPTGTGVGGIWYYGCPEAGN